MRIMNLVLCDDGKNDKTIRALASDGKLYDIADISKDLFDILVATRIRKDLQVDGFLDESRRRKAEDISTAGWYKICDFPEDTAGKSYLISLSRNYNYNNSESYLINISLAYQTGKMHLIGKQVNTLGFSQVALYRNSTNSISLYAYYSLSTVNGCTVSMLSNSANFTLDLTQTTPAGSLIYTLNLSSPVVTALNTICQRHKRYHTDDGINVDNAITEYSFAYSNASSAGLSGPMLSIGTLADDGQGDYRLQLIGEYSNGNAFVIRTYDGDSGTWNGWRTIYTSANTVPVSNGGTGATSASGALSNLGAMPLSYGQSVALWTGICNRGGSVTIPNANKYGALIVYCTPGSGESEVITCIYRARGYKFQIASNQAYCMLSATNSGDNKVFTVDSGSSSGATLNGVYGLSRFKS